MLCKCFIVFLIPHVYASFTCNTRFFTKYRNYAEVLDSIAEVKRYTEDVSVRYIGLSSSGLSIPCVQIAEKNQRRKPIIVIDAGSQGREWISVSTALYIIFQLLKYENKHMIRNVEWHILPVINPDGYIYSFYNNRTRFWGKNRSYRKGCFGVNLLRNFDMDFMGTDSSSKPCHVNYAGPYAFSERETYSFQLYAKEYAQTISLYISLHSYGSIIAYPFFYKVRVPENLDELQNLGSIVANEIKKHRGTQYTVGSGAGLLRGSAGRSEDWMKCYLQIPLVYSIYLPRFNGRGYNPPPHLIEDVGIEIFRGVRIFHDHILNNYFGKLSLCQQLIFRMMKVPNITIIPLNTALRVDNEYLT